MSLPIAARQYFAATPPRAHGAALPGECVVLATGTVASYLELDTLFAAASPLVGNLNFPGAVNQFVEFFADTADLGIVFGPTAASVSSSNAPVLTQDGTVTTGAYTGHAGTCYRIVAGTSKKWLLQLGVDLFVGFVGSTTGQLRLYVASMPNA